MSISQAGKRRHREVREPTLGHQLQEAEPGWGSRQFGPVTSSSSSLWERRKKQRKSMGNRSMYRADVLDSRPSLGAEGKEAGAPRLHRQGHVRGEGGQRGGPSVASQPVAPHNPSPWVGKYPWQQQRSKNTGLPASLIIEEVSHCNQTGDHPGLELQTNHRKNSSFQMCREAEPRAEPGRWGLGVSFWGVGFLRSLLHHRSPSQPLGARHFWDSFKQYLLLYHVKQI